MPTGGLNNTPSGGTTAGATDDERLKKRHPKTSYGSEYYYNDKRTWEAGHELEFDSTKDKERIRLAHAHGSYFEYSKDGHKVESTKGHEHKYVQGGLTHTIDNNTDIKYHGNVRTSVGKGIHMEINGKSSVAIAKETAISFGKSASIVSVNDLFIVAKNTTMQTGEHFNMDVGGDFGIKTKGKMNFRSKGGVAFKTDGEFLAKVEKRVKIEGNNTGDFLFEKDVTHKSKSGKMTQESEKKFSVMTQDDYEQKAEKKASFKGQSGVTIDGATVDIKPQ